MLFKLEAICSQAFALSTLLTLWAYGSVTKSSLQKKCHGPLSRQSWFYEKRHKPKITLTASVVDPLFLDHYYKGFTRNGKKLRGGDSYKDILGNSR